MSARYLQNDDTAAALRSCFSVSLLLCWSLFPPTTIYFTTSTRPSSSDSSSSSSIPVGSHCSAWVDRCTGEHHCTAGGGNSTDPTPPSCYPPIPANLTPAPGVCTLVNGSCQFVNPCKECYSSNTQCINKSCDYQSSSAPPLKLTECLPINGTCQEYNPCRMWPGYCGGPYQCITDVQYYRYTHGPAPPICPIPIPLRPKPPGECIYLNGQCAWSSKC